jgi:predicted permease
MGSDLLLALRSLRRAPIFATAATLTVALGVGANVAVFSVVNALLLRPLPMRDADRLVVVATQEHSRPTMGGVSFADLEDYREATAEVFEDVAGYNVGFAGLARESGADPGRPERVLVTWITGGYFTLLDVRPALGRAIRPDEVGPGRTAAVALLGHSTWQRRFGGDREVLGRTVRVNGRTCTIVGVTPPGFRGTFAFSDSELYLPIGWPGEFDFASRRSRDLHALARLRSGVSIERAQAAMEVVADRLAREHPDSNGATSVRVVPERLARPQEDNARSNRRAAALVLALVALVLCLAGANATSLLLARAEGRRRELATRAALGAGRARLVREMAVEGLLVAAFGGAAGIAIGGLTARALAGGLRVPGDLPVRFDFGLDARVVGYAVLIALGTGLAVGCLAGVRASSGLDPSRRPRSAGASLARTLRRADGRPGGVEANRTRRTIVTVQVAACFVILVVAGLLLRSSWAAEHADLGFEPEGILNVHMDVGQLGYSEAEGRAFFDEVERRVLSMPGVRSASFAFTIPMGYVQLTDRVEAEGSTGGDDGRTTAGLNITSARYFETLGIELVRGSGFDVVPAVPDDDARPRPVAVVNERLAAALWPDLDATDGDPIGRRFRSAAEGGPWVEVVGVTETGKYRFLFEDPQPYFYLPIARHYVGLRVLQVRTAVSPETLAPAVERTIHGLEPSLPLYDVQTMSRALGGGPGLFVVRAGAATAATLGLVGLALAIVGLYGLVAHTTMQRRHEMGVRMSLGATCGSLLLLVLREASELLALGLGAGVAVALGGGQALERFLFGVSAGDVPTFAAVAALLVLVALFACAMPAWRAATAAPTAALRSE